MTDTPPASTDVQLSEHQRAAVTHDLRDAVVIAGAGSGKTRVLTERFVHLVTHLNVPLHAITAMTFSERAALEMRERIGTRFQELARQGDAVGAYAADAIDVGTVHAWCARLLRRNAVAAAVDPGFEVLDANEAKLLREECFVGVEREAAQDANAAATVRGDLITLGRYLTGNPRSRLLEVYGRVRGAARSVGALRWHDPDGHLVAGRLPPKGGGDAELRACVEEVRECLRGIRKRDDAADYATPLAGVEAGLADIGAALEDIASSPQGEIALAFRLQAAMRDLPKSTALPRGPWWKARKALERAVAARAAHGGDQLGGAILLPAVQRVLEHVHKRYEAAKRAQRLFDFNDLEVHALRFLQDLATSNQRLEHAPRVVLVDEFQDTNPVQAALLEHLRGHGARVFLVGDPKQSIYRFRRADVSVLQGYQREVARDCVHRLATSYRATPELTAVVNALHACLFEQDAAGVTYEALEAGAEFHPPEADHCPVTFTIVNSQPEVDGEVHKLDPATVEAQEVADQIRRLVDSGLPRRGEDRALRYGDVAILVRTHARKLPLEEALRGADIPFRTLGGLGWHNGIEIADLRDALRVIHDPEDRFALAAFLTGPALAVSESVLLDLFREDDATTGASPWARLRKAAAKHAGLARFVATVDRLRAEAIQGSLVRVVQGVLQDLGLLTVHAQAGDGPTRVANLRKAVQRARRMTDAGRRGLTDLLRELEREEKAGVDEGEGTVGGDDNVVRILTIHAAKGLEFPVVFLPGASAPRPSRRSDDALTHPDADGVHTEVALRILDPIERESLKPGALIALGDQEDAAEAQQFLRLFYVAATRAQERLFLVGTCRNLGAKGPTHLTAWSAAIKRCVTLPPGYSTVDLPIKGDAPQQVLRVRIVPGALAPAQSGDAPRAGAPAEVGAPVPLLSPPPSAPAPRPLGATPYVATVSEIVAFARREQSPPAPVSAPRRRARSSAWLGTVVHDVLDVLVKTRPWTREERDACVVDVCERALPRDQIEDRDAILAQVATYLDAFEASEWGERILASEADVRSELAFHARIRFPGGAAVGPFEALLVKGTIDLWVPTQDPTNAGVWLIDYKTSAPGASLEAFELQLRMYALAAERLTGHDVSGAGVLLLDPAWSASGDRATFREIDIGGEALAATRSILRAFASDALEQA